MAAKNGQPRPAISPEALAELERRAWLGNVRELRNAVEYAMILARGGSIAPEHLPPPVAEMARERAAVLISQDEALRALVRQWADRQLRDPAGSEDLYDRLLQCVERPLLEAAMEHCGGQCVAAARRLGLHRTTLRKKLDELGIGDS